MRRWKMYWKILQNVEKLMEQLLYVLLSCGRNVAGRIVLRSKRKKKCAGWNSLQVDVNKMPLSLPQ